jgi:ATP-binding cassette subfamily A (ABC1) protein 3
MEEAEALCTKMGIMVKGGVFKCFGSSQHIRHKFGTGFVIEIKIRTLDESELDEKNKFKSNQEFFTSQIT